MAPKNSTRVRTTIASSPAYEKHEPVSGTVVQENDFLVRLGPRTVPCELYTITHTRYGTEATEQLLVTDPGADTCYIWSPDPAETMDPPGPRPPWALLYRGRRWVPRGIQDQLMIWAVDGSERDYSDTAVGLLEAYWADPTKPNDRDREAAMAWLRDSVNAPADLATRLRADAIEILGEPYVQGYLAAASLG